MERAVSAAEGAIEERPWRFAGRRPDRVARHQRRNRLAPLRRTVQEAGLRPLRASYVNYLLFLPIVLARLLIDAFGIEQGSKGEINMPLFNRVLAAALTRG